MKTVNFILILGTLFIILGSVLKISHTGVTFSNEIYLMGFALGGVYLILKQKKKNSNSNL